MIESVFEQAFRREGGVPGMIDRWSGCVRVWPRKAVAVRCVRADARANRLATRDCRANLDQRSRECRTNYDVAELTVAEQILPEQTRTKQIFTRKKVSR